MKSINVIIIAVLVGAAAFFSGIKFRDYQISKQRANFAGGQFFRQGAGAGGNGQNRNGNGARPAGGGAVLGEILNMDDKSITVKMQDGSTKIVVLTDNTSYSKSAEGSKSDLKTGERVGVFGTANSDGSITAQNIQLNPEFRAFGSNNQSPTNPPSK